MQAAIAAAGQEGDTLGGVFEVVAFGFPPGVGSYAQADRRLGARLAAALLGIPAIKGVEIGLGFAAARLPGSRVHDEIVWSRGRRLRPHLATTPAASRAASPPGCRSSCAPR